MPGIADLNKNLERSSSGSNFSGGKKKKVKSENETHIVVDRIDEYLLHQRDKDYDAHRSKTKHFYPSTLGKGLR